VRSALDLFALVGDLAGRCSAAGGRSSSCPEVGEDLKHPIAIEPREGEAGGVAGV
jgi:hypothetical protein